MNTIVFPCPEKVDCPGSDLPISNFSSEAIDGPLFIGLFWGSQGLGICESPVDQETADLCAARDDCITNTNPRFFNNPQSGIAFCPDGNPFIFTAPAGLFCANTQGDADANALAYANSKAQQRMFCLSCPAHLTDGVLQVGVPYSSGFGFSGAATSVQFSLIFGEFPPGLTMNSAGAVTGIPTQAGSFNTFVQGVDQNGDFMVKQCAWVIGSNSPVCHDPGNCAPGTCWNTTACECLGYFNDAQSGTLTCPCNNTIQVSGTIPKCTFQSSNPADYPANLNQEAATALAALLLQRMAATGCSNVSINGSTVLNNGGCPISYQVFHTNGSFYDPTFHSINVAVDSSVEWCSFLHGMTGSDPFGTGYFDLGGGVRSYFSCPHM